MADADLSHLLNDDFPAQADKMRSELAENGHEFSDEQRANLQVKMLQERQFYHPYSKELFDQDENGYRKRWMEWYSTIQ